MAEENVVETGAEIQAAPVAESTVVSESVSEVPAESHEPAPAPEKMIPQSQVNRIAAREAREAAEKARNEERARYERERAQSIAQSQPDAAPQNIGGIQQHSQDDIRRMIQEEAWRLSQTEMASRIEREWLSAMNAEKDADPEFSDLYDALNIEAHPDLLLWMNGLENKTAVVKDIAKNPSKFSNILMLARSGSPKLAEMELRKLSASIKANGEAQKQAAVDTPLSQIKPSNIGSDSGGMSVKDYMAQPWLRG